METESKKKFLTDFTYAAVATLLGFFIGKFVFQYLTPFILAVVIASLMQKPAARIANKTPLSKEICAAFLAAGIYILAAGLLFFIIYRLFTFSGVLIDELPELFSYLSGLYNSFTQRFYGIIEKSSPEIANEVFSIIEDSLFKLTSNATDFVSRIAAVIVKGIPSFLFSSIVALVASCYIAKDYDRLRKFLKGFLSERIFGNIIKIRKILYTSVFKLIKGYFILTIAAYIQLLLGFFVLKIKYAPLVALIVAIIDLLPVLGTGTVLIPWGLILIATSNSFTGIGLIILYLITVIVRNFLEPKIIGGQIGINPLFTLIAMFVGLKLLGFWGIIIMPVVLIVTFEYYKTKTDKT